MVTFNSYVSHYQRVKHPKTPSSPDEILFFAASRPSTAEFVQHPLLRRLRKRCKTPKELGIFSGCETLMGIEWIKLNGI
jgi:hypothetical protein